MNEYFQLNDERFIIANTGSATDEIGEFIEDGHLCEILSNNNVEQITVIYDSSFDHFESKLNDQYKDLKVKHKFRNLEDLHQYHFERCEISKIFEELFPCDSEAWDWDCVCICVNLKILLHFMRLEMMVNSIYYTNQVEL